MTEINERAENGIGKGMILTWKTTYKLDNSLESLVLKRSHNFITSEMQTGSKTCI